MRSTPPERLEHLCGGGISGALLLCFPKSLSLKRGVQKSAKALYLNPQIQKPKFKYLPATRGRPSPPPVATYSPPPVADRTSGNGSRSNRSRAALTSHGLGFKRPPLTA